MNYEEYLQPSELCDFDRCPELRDKALELALGCRSKKETFRRIFDFVTSFHTISVVSRPQAMMSEVVRVCKPGGRIMIIKHFRSDNPIIARVVDSAGNLTKHLGWRTDLDLNEVLSELPVRLDHRYKPNPLSLFTVMKATCKPEQALSRAV